MTISPKHKEKPMDFTRQRKISFKGILISVLINLKRSLAVEIDSFIKKLDSDINLEYTKQAYSKARQNLKPTAYIELNDIIVGETYTNKFKQFKGYRLLAVDGSTIQLPNTKDMREKYGVFSENKADYPAAKLCLTYDVLNEIILNGKMYSYTQSEQEIATELIPTIHKSSARDIYIFDRGFPSVRFIVLLNKLDQKYIFRVKRSFLKEVKDFANSTADDKILKVNMTQRRIASNKIKGVEPVGFDLRCVRIKLETEDEILVTNLTDKEMNIEELKFIYNKRWGIETKYNLLKNGLELENFTGDTDRAVLQDFYATIYISNLASIMIADAQEEYEKNRGDEKKKHEYKINKRIALAYLKNDLLHVLLQKDPGKASKLYEKFIKKLSKQVVPIRDNRKFERPTSHIPKFGRTNKRVF